MIEVRSPTSDSTAGFSGLIRSKQSNLGKVEDDDIDDDDEKRKENGSIIEDPPVENAELDGTEQERVEACLRQNAEKIELMERQEKELRIASREGNCEKILQLLDAKVDVNATNASRTCPLHEAAYAGKPDAVEVLLSNWAEVDKPDCWGATALHFAAAGGCAESCQILLDHGADVDRRRQDMKRAIDVVKREKHPKAFEVVALQCMALSEKRRRLKNRKLMRMFMGSLVAGGFSYMLMFGKHWFPADVKTT